MAIVVKPFRNTARMVKIELQPGLPQPQIGVDMRL